MILLGIIPVPSCSYCLKIEFERFKGRFRNFGVESPVMPSKWEQKDIGTGTGFWESASHIRGERLEDGGECKFRRSFVLDINLEAFQSCVFRMKAP